MSGSSRASGEAPTRSHASADWAELRHHASWPAADTIIREITLTLPSGTFDCWRYTVMSREDGLPVLSRFDFAKSLPGAPVRYDEIRGGARVSRMTLIAFGDVPAATNPR